MVQVLGGVSGLIWSILGAMGGFSGLILTIMCAISISSGLLICGLGILTAMSWF